MNRIFYRFVSLANRSRIHFLKSSPSNLSQVDLNYSCRLLHFQNNLSLLRKSSILLNNYRYIQASHTESSHEESQIESTYDRVNQFRSEHRVFVNNVEDGKNIFNFNELDMPEKLHELMNRLGYSKPTPIQAQSLPILFSGLDLIGIAQTGSGKTLAYLLPAFSKFFPIHRQYWNSEEYQSEKRLNPKVLVLAPTRELAVQISDVIRQFRIFKSICLYGGSDRKRQIRFLENNSPLFVVATPGRLKDVVDSGFIDLSEINYLVVDEADRMLDMGFEPQISYLIDQCPEISDRQTMMFSASWPDEVKSLVAKYLKPNHAFVSIGGTKLVANHNIQQNIIVCDYNDRYRYLEEIFQNHSNEKTLVFCNTKRDCDKISMMINRKFRIRSTPLHGDMTQRQRETALNDFKNGHLKVLCATNVAARGLDIDDVNVVINYDFPGDIETYVHRIGRTGRKNKKGVAYSFFVDRSNSLLAMKLIEILQESNNKVSDELIEISQNRFSTKISKKPKFVNHKNHRQRYFRY